MLTLSASELSSAIRAKKKKLAESPPELAGTSPTPDMNAQDVYDVTQKARIEDQLDSPAQINADKTMLDEPENAEETLQRKAKAGVEAIAHVPADPDTELPRLEAEGGIVDPPDGLAEPEALGSKAEVGEAGWNASKFRRLGRLNAFLDSLDIY
jgi:hypothetical protein